MLSFVASVVGILKSFSQCLVKNFSRIQWVYIFVSDERQDHGFKDHIWILCIVEKGTWRIIPFSK